MPKRRDGQKTVDSGASEGTKEAAVIKNLQTGRSDHPLRT